MSDVWSDLVRATCDLQASFLRHGLKPDFEIVFNNPDDLLDLSSALAKNIGGLCFGALAKDLAPGEFKLNGIRFVHRAK